MKKNWIALFSHTGSEIAHISHKLKRWPDNIITNQSPAADNICEDINRNKIHFTKTKPTVSEYNKLFKDADIITLHGWMRIVPGEICDKYNIINLHPGLITKYPELKGKDPQRRVFENTTKTYDWVGCVIHRAIAEVDAGDILMTSSVRNTFNGENDLTTQLHKMASDMWIDLLRMEGI